MAEILFRASSSRVGFVTSSSQSRSLRNWSSCERSLFATTYPCHVCARHLVAAGIRESYFIEPYKKSLAIKLHGDALSESEDEIDKVRLIPFDGVAPNRYMSFFRMAGSARKRDGKAIRISPVSASPRLHKSLKALPALEDLVIESLQQRMLAGRAAQTQPT